MATRLKAGVNGLEKVVLETEDGVVEIYRLGATITRYQCQGRDLIFVSDKSPYVVGKAIRGGVPVCWPWFGAHPTDAGLPQHGFVRTREWALVESGEDGCVLGISASEETRKIWPYEFELRLEVKVEAGRLTYGLVTKNTGGESFRMGEALHTYFRVGEVSKATVSGLKGLRYVDKVNGGKVKVEEAERVEFAGETDRVYVGASGPHELASPVGVVRVVKRGSADTVIWNPGEGKAEKMADLSGGQWPGFCCVEAVNTGEHSVVVEAGGEHVMSCAVEVL